jgi:hypothetical protein
MIGCYCRRSGCPEINLKVVHFKSVIVPQQSYFSWGCNSQLTRNYNSHSTVLRLKCNVSCLWMSNNLEFPLLNYKYINSYIRLLRCDVLQTGIRYHLLGGTCCLHIQVSSGSLLSLVWRGRQEVPPKLRFLVPLMMTSYLNSCKASYASLC